MRLRREMSHKWQLSMAPRNGENNSLKCLASCPSRRKAKAARRRGREAVPLTFMPYRRRGFDRVIEEASASAIEKSLNAP